MLGGNDCGRSVCFHCIDMKCDDDINTTPFSESTQQRKAKRKESEGEVRYSFVCFFFPSFYVLFTFEKHSETN